MATSPCGPLVRSPAQRWRGDRACVSPPHCMRRSFSVPVEVSVDLCGVRSGRVMLARRRVCCNSAGFCVRLCGARIWSAINSCTTRLSHSRSERRDCATHARGVCFKPARPARCGGLSGVFGGVARWRTSVVSTHCWFPQETLHRSDAMATLVIVAGCAVSVSFGTRSADVCIGRAARHMYAAAASHTDPAFSVMELFALYRTSRFAVYGVSVLGALAFGVLSIHRCAVHWRVLTVSVWSCARKDGVATQGVRRRIAPVSCNHEVSQVELRTRSAVVSCHVLRRAPAGSRTRASLASPAHSLFCLRSHLCH